MKLNTFHYWNRAIQDQYDDDRAVTVTTRPTQYDSLVNLSPPSATYKHQWIGSALVQIMACCLFSTKPLSKPMLSHCQLDPWEQTSVKFQSKYNTFYSRNCIWKCHLWIGSHFVQGEMSKTKHPLVTWTCVIWIHIDWFNLWGHPVNMP